MVKNIYIQNKSQIHKLKDYFIYFNQLILIYNQINLQVSITTIFIFHGRKTRGFFIIEKHEDGEENDDKDEKMKNMRMVMKMMTRMSKRKI